MKLYLQMVKYTNGETGTTIRKSPEGKVEAVYCFGHTQPNRNAKKMVFNYVEYEIVWLEDKIIEGSFPQSKAQTFTVKPPEWEDFGNLCRFKNKLGNYICHWDMNSQDPNGGWFFNEQHYKTKELAKQAAEIRFNADILSMLNPL